jgi:hypothetical protein
VVDAVEGRDEGEGEDTTGAPRWVLEMNGEAELVTVVALESLDCALLVAVLLCDKPRLRASVELDPEAVTPESPLMLGWVGRLVLDRRPRLEKKLLEFCLSRLPCPKPESWDVFAWCRTTGLDSPGDPAGWLASIG